MYQAVLQAVRDNASALATSQSNLRGKISACRDPSGNTIDIDQNIPDAEYTISDLDVGIRTLVTFVESIDGNELGIIVPRSAIEALSTRLNELKSQVDGVSGIFDNVAQQGGPKSIDRATFMIVANQNDAQHSLLKSLRRMFTQLDAALVAWFQLRAILKNPKMNEFSRMLGGISEWEVELSKSSESNVRLNQLMESERAKISDLFSQVSSEREEVGRLLRETQNDRKTLNEYSAEGTESISSMRATHNETSTLQNAVAEYKSNFQRFDDQLKSREEKFQKENDELERIHGVLSAHDAEIKRLTNEAEGMLRGATNAGLAASFSTLQSKINSELRLARWSFYFSIVFLVILSTPIALYVFPGLNSVISALIGIDTSVLLPKSAANHTTSDVIAQVAARALLLVPGIWLVRFTSARHERLFRLREHW
jgi:hypothetical protein